VRPWQEQVDLVKEILGIEPRWYIDVMDPEGGIMYRLEMNNSLTSRFLYLGSLQSSHDQRYWEALSTSALFYLCNVSLLFLIAKCCPLPVQVPSRV